MCIVSIFYITSIKYQYYIHLDCKVIKPVNPKRNQSWLFIRRTDTEAEALILWPPDVKNWLIGKDPDAGKDWRWEEKRTTEDEMVEWHHWLNGHEFEQAPGDGDGRGRLACCSPWGHKESNITEWLNNNNNKIHYWSGEGNGNPVQYSCLKNSMDRGTWRVTVHGVAESLRHDWATNTFTIDIVYTDYICAFI